MAYSATYVTTDIAPITIDLVATLLAALTGQMGTIAQLIVVLIILGVLGGIFAAVSGFFNAVAGFGRGR
jgi:hypothetical protein